MTTSPPARVVTSERVVTTEVERAANGERVVRIGAREAQRLKERFLTRATAVFYARITFLLLGLGILLIPSWRRAFDATGVAAWSWFAFAVVTSFVCQAFAAHPLHGRRVMFLTLTFDLVLLLAIIDRSGGLVSPAMGAQLLFTLFFSLLFPNPIAIVPPVLVLPAVIVLGHRLPGGPPLSEEVMRLAWYIALNCVTVYVTVYLTAREEKQNREILELEQELKKLAIVEERNRLARDIHDGLGASLSGLIIQAEYLLTLTKGNEKLTPEIGELKVGAEEAIDEVRRAVSMMRDDFVLVPQLANMCTTFTARHRLPVDLKLHGEAPDLAEEQELSIFRILQECLTNIAKHAKAKTVTVEVFFNPGLIVMDIVDDGAGFDPARTPKNHYGLINMRERARKAGGEVSITSRPGEGTTVKLTINRLAAPLAPAA